MHLIRRQILDLELPREQGAAEMARRAGRLFQEKVLPELDKIFTRIAPEGRILRIDRMEIDLRYLPEIRFEQEFVEQCIQQIIKQVGEIAFEVRPSEASGSVQTLSAAENALTVFLYFLEFGALPWYAKGWVLPDVAQAVTQLLSTHPERIRQTVPLVLTKTVQIAQRLIWQFSPDFVEKIIETAFELVPDSLTQAIRIRQSQTAQILTATQKATLLQAVIRSPDRTPFRQPLTPGLLSAWFYENDMTGLPTLKPASELQAPEAVPLMKSQGDAPSSTEQLPTSVPEPDGQPTGVPPLKSRGDAAPSTEYQPAAPPLSAEQLPASESKPADSRPAPQKPQPRRAAAAEGISVANAGLVLLAPYLPVLFKTLGIQIRQQDSTDRNAQFHAIHMLHFLAAGYENPEEQLLILPKILCGVPVDEPVPQELILPEAEKNECNQLLEAVIRNWPVLKNTRPDGLRGAFLQRQGLLFWSEERQSWQLRIERQGQDLLLDRLPWTYSVAKLEWMEHILLVEW